jgi:hypothetical protein
MTRSCDDWTRQAAGSRVADPLLVGQFFTTPAEPNGPDILAIHELGASVA